MEDIRFSYMVKDEVIAEVEFNYSTGKVKVKNYIDDPVMLPFGVNENPTIKDLDRFLESRCVSRNRGNLKDVLNLIGVEEYDPYLIVRETYGLLWDDYSWIKFEDEVDLTYEDIKIRE